MFRLHPTTNNSIAVGLSIDAEKPGDWLHTIGTIWLTGKLRVDNQTKQLTPSPADPFDFKAHTDNAATNFLFTIARLPVVREKIVRSFLQSNFAKQYDAARNEAMSALNNPVGQGFSLSTKTVDATVPSDIESTQDGIFIGIVIKGDVRVNLAQSSSN